MRPPNYGLGGRRRGRGKCYDIAVLPDGRIVCATGQWLVVHGRNGSVQWLQTQGKAQFVDTLPGGRLVTGIETSRALYCWAAADGRCLQTLTDETEPGGMSFFVCLATLSDGRVVAGYSDYTLKVWDVTRGRVVQTLAGHEDEVVNVAAMPGGRVASASWDGTVKYWDVEDGQCHQTLEHDDEVNCVAALPGGSLVSAGEVTMKKWDPKAGHCLLTIEVGGRDSIVWCIAALSDNIVVGGCQDNAIRLWDMTDGHCIQVLHRHSEPVRHVAAMSNGRFVSVAQSFGKVDGERWVPPEDHAIAVWLDRQRVAEKHMGKAVARERMRCDDVAKIITAFL